MQNVLARSLCLNCGQHFTRSQHCRSGLCYFLLVPQSEMDNGQASVVQPERIGDASRMQVGEIPRSLCAAEQAIPGGTSCVLPKQERGEEKQPFGFIPAPVSASESEKRRKLYESDGPRYDSDQGIERPASPFAEDRRLLSYDGTSKA